MSVIKPYPHYEINVEDRSIYEPVELEWLPIHRPVYMLRAQQGPVGIPVWCNTAAEAKRVFGDATFDDSNGTYFGLEGLFLNQTFQYDGAFLVRLADTSALQSVKILECQVNLVKGENQTNVQSWGNTGELITTEPTEEELAVLKDNPASLRLVWKYKKSVVFETMDDLVAGVDVDGVSHDGAIDYIAIVNHAYPKADLGKGKKSCSPENMDYFLDYLQEDGSAMFIKTDDSEEHATFRMLTVEVMKTLGRGELNGWTQNTDQLVTVPMICFVANNPGVWGNTCGFSLYVDDSDNDYNMVDRNKGCFYRFTPWRQPDPFSTADKVMDINNSTYQSFTFVENGFDSNNKLQTSMEAVFKMNYTKKAPLPFSVVFLRDNWKTVCDIAFDIMFRKLIGFKKVTVKQDDVPVVAYKYTYGYPDLYDPRLLPTDDDQKDFKANADWMNILTGKGWHSGVIGGYTDASGDHIVETGPVYGVYSSYNTSNAWDAYGDLITDNVVATQKIFVNNKDDMAVLNNATKGIEYYKDSKNTIVFLENGTDGKLDAATHEENMKKFLELKVNPDILDQARYPFTHMFGVGYAYNTKVAMLGFLDTREDVKVVIATQEVTGVQVNSSGEMIEGVVSINTQGEDRAIAESLRQTARLQRESIVKGTECCRATIVMQCGKMLTGLYNGYVPLTFWHASKKAQYQNTDHLDREPKGLPWAKMDLLEDINWIPSSEDMKSLNWNAAANYVQYYDMQNLHYAAIRSVYSYETSVLLDDVFVDAIVYTKHEIRQSWAVYTGRTDPFATLKVLIEKDMTNRLFRLYNNKYTFTVLVYQTEEDVRLGYVLHVRVEVTAPGMKRVWLVDVICKREGYEG